MAGVDADVKRELRVVREVLHQTRQFGVHLEGDSQGSLGVVVMADRRSEQRHQRVACEFLDVTAVAPDDAAQP